MSIVRSSTPRARRRRAVAFVIGALTASALALPGAASAGSTTFCADQWLVSGQNCFASDTHTLQSVEGYTVGSHRVCAASASGPSGSISSDWVCSYTSVIKNLNGRVFGVGVVHNGAPETWQLWFAVHNW
jgi:hypothetical protein